MNFSMWLILFFKIIWFLILPLIIILISISIWKYTLCNINWFENENNTFKNILSLIFGFFIVLTTIVIIWMLGFYNIYNIVWVLLLYLIISWKNLYKYLEYFINYRFEFSKSEWYGLKLLSTEFLFILSTLLLSINLISAFRPFPIGWDDLWAYMNYAQLLAESWKIFNVTSMFSWETFTGIWYIFNSPTQAFFLNNVWWILSFILMIAIFSDLLKSKIKKHFINIPLLLATIFISMPMFIFEQAKDMKLDPGLYFVSISAVYLILKLLLNTDKNSFKNKFLSFLGNQNTTIWSKYIYYLLIWIILGFAFSIKFTSLLLISGLLALLFYARLWLFALLGYLGIYFSIFTKFWLWKLMNVSYPHTDIIFINNFSLLTGIIGLLLFIYSLLINKNKIKWFFIKLISILIWIIIALLPWFLFNYSKSDTLNISTLISWDKEYLKINYLDIYSETELEKINEKLDLERMSASGTTTNEDFWRYFGYEEGINNYVKLPWNLSMQVNQKWEFTDITYIYLALLPLILLFLPFKKNYYSVWVIILFIIGLLLFWFNSTAILLTEILSKFNLPGWYLLLFLGFLIPLFYFLYSVKDSWKWILFKYISVFTFFYVFLWTIAAYWIVWYWIVMYFCFLLIIGLGLYYGCSYNDKSDDKEKQSKLLGSLVILTIICIYFFSSSFPHAFNNLKQASYKEFKSWDVTSIEAPYLYHQEYLKIVFELNIEHNKKEDFIKSNLTENTIKLIEAINNQGSWTQTSFQQINMNNIENLVWNLRKLRNDQNLSKYHKDISNSLTNIYEWITHPSDEFKNTKSIYRIWTFLKYYISENNKRILEDALVVTFDTYIKTITPDETVNNMKKLGLNYFLVDLNAATIDNDPRRNLTKRYEWLLKTFTSDKLELVSTDSICLQLAREDFSKSDKTEEDYSMYLKLAWVNYNSYNLDWITDTKQHKLATCYNRVFTLIQESKINNSEYRYLIPVYNYIAEKPEIHWNLQELYNVLSKFAPHWYKVLFRIKD